MRIRTKITLTALLAAIALAAPAWADNSGPTTYVGSANGGVWKTTNGGSQAGITDGTSTGGDGAADIVTQSGFQGGARAASGGVGGGIRAFEPTFTGGVRVGAGDVNGDGKADIVTQSGHTGVVRAAVGGINGDGKQQDFHMPTDQRPNPTGDGTVNQVYGDLLGRNSNGSNAGDNTYSGSHALYQDVYIPAAPAGVPSGGVGAADGNGKPSFQLPTDQKVRFGSLNGLGSMDQLFVNSRGGDQTTGLLLPAVQAAREAARSSASSAHGGGGGAGKVQMQDFHFAMPSAGQGGGKTPTQDIITGAGAGGTPHVKSLDNTRAPGGLATGPNAGLGAGPHVKVFSGKTGAAAGPSVAGRTPNVVVAPR